MELSIWKQRTLNFAILFPTFLVVFDYAVVGICLPYILASFSLKADVGSYIVTAFAVGNTIMLPAAGCIAQKFGPLRGMKGSIIGFMLFSALCPFAQNLPLLLLFRFLQGIFSGPLIPLSQGILLKVNPENRKVQMMALFSTFMSIGPSFGPLIGGFVSYDLYWGWAFWMNIPLAGICLYVLQKAFKSIKEIPQKSNFDWVGFILVFLWQSFLLIFLDRGEQYGWLTSWGLTLVALGFVLPFIFFLVWQLYGKEPFLDLSFFKIPSFTVATILFAFFYAIYFGAVLTTPLWLQQQMHYPPPWAGLGLSSMGIFPFLSGFFMAKLIKRVGAMPLLFLALILLTCTCFVSAYFTTYADFFHISLSRFFYGVGFGLFITPIFSLFAQDIPLEQIPHAAGLFSFLRSTFGNIGGSFFLSLWIRRSTFHHVRLSERTTALDAQTLEWLQKIELLIPETRDLVAKKWAVLNEVVSQQAAMMGLNDLYFFMGSAFIGMLLLLTGLYFYSSKRKQKESII